jgi:hypothetical protein
VALQVAERAVVSDEFEAVVRSLKGATGTMSTIATVADVRGEECYSFVVTQAAYPPRRLAF